MTLSLKKILANSLFYTGITFLATKLFPIKGITVLMYHKANPTHFEKQIRYLKKHYNPINEQQLVEYYYADKELPKNSVLITFDDGYLNNYEVAWPVLKKEKTPATIFIITDFVGKKDIIWYDKIEHYINHNNQVENKEKKVEELQNEAKKLDLKHINLFLKEHKIKSPKIIPKEYKFMNKKQLNEIKMMISLGGHTLSHPILTNETTTEIKKQIEKSNTNLKKIINKQIISFAYPNGNYNSEILQILKETEYKIAFTTRSGINNKNTNPYELRRKGINKKDTLPIFALKLTKIWDLIK